MNRTFVGLALARSLALILLIMSGGFAAADPVTIVAVGASNTSGFNVGEQNAYPARLEALLRAKGIDAVVINAGVGFDTTAGMLRRLDSSVPDGTKLRS